jgi:predicted TIM-barrel fold metal-dependent hydrolase
MIIDWQHHFSSEELYRKRGKTGQMVMKEGKVTMLLHEESYQIDKHLEFMDEAGIDMAVLSTTLHAVEDCRLIDDHYAKTVSDYPDRFVCLAPCLPTRGKEALGELDRAINHLGLKGVVISPQNDGEGLDSHKLWPFYEKISQMDVPIFVHITSAPVGFEAMEALYNLNVTMTREFDIASNTARLIMGGVLTNFPDLKIIVSHLGGGISAIMDRIERYVHVWGKRFWSEVSGTPPIGEPYRENFRKQFDRLYFDMAGYEGGMNAVRCALTRIKPDRLLYGTDYPYNFTNDAKGAKRYIDNIRKLDIPSKAIEGMLGGNAARLMGINNHP